MFRVHFTIWFSAVALSLASCRSGSSKAEPPTAPSSSAAPTTPTLPPPLSSADVEAALNPEHMKPYSGPIGAVTGVVRASGDPPPEMSSVLAKIPAGKCEDARAFYGKLFREGPNRELGDVLVAVTAYPGYLPAPEGVKLVTARDCAFESRTLAAVFGQRIDVKNRGRETVTPELRGAKTPALLVAVPGGDAVPLFAEHVGEYELIDRSHPFATASFLVLKFPTFAVTGIDGKFTIPNIPAGDVMVSAYLPATKKTAQAHVKVVAGETADVELTIPYSASESPRPAASH